MAEGNDGKVVQVIGTVVDVAFPPDQIPALFNALELEVAGQRLVLEVEQQVGNNWVRCLAYSTVISNTASAPPSISRHLPAMARCNARCIMGQP